MYVPLEKMISAAGTGYRVYKWWKTRRDAAARVQRRRQLARDAALTAFAVAGALTGMVLLASAN